jgi:hypothetical protein
MKLLTVLLAFAALGAGGCDTVDYAPKEYCSDVPDGGCPLSNGVACEDPMCGAVYACNAGVWSLDHECPTIDAAVEDGGTEAGADTMPDFDAASIDAPPGSFGGPGCADLEEPDCPLGEALACGPSCCDCEDLWVCVDMGWTEWGTCTPGSGVMQNN